MAAERVLVDTGPLVALLRRNDAAHERCVSEAKAVGTPLLTSEAVLTEAFWLLRDLPRAASQLLLEIEQGVVVPLSLDRAAYPWIRNYVGKYQDLSPQWADATLCYLADRESTRFSPWIYGTSGSIETGTASRFELFQLDQVHLVRGT